jgi:hypothetical protein
MNKTRFGYALLVAAVCGLFAFYWYLDASRGPGYQALSSETKEMMNRQGWSYHDTLGVPGKAVIESWFSAQSKKLTVKWRERGVVQVKELDQSEYWYKMVSCEKEDGDSFTVMFRKSK